MDEGLRKLISKAESGDIEAMVMVGDCYNRGFHTEKDDAMSHAYYRMAAERGHAGGAFMVAVDYLSGIGTSENKNKGIKYLKIAAKQGLANAQYLLATMYQSGEIGAVFKDLKTVQYYEYAAKQGHAKAQLELGDMNIMNRGSLYSVEVGLFWLICAYLHGDDAPEESNSAKGRLISLLQANIPGGKERIERMSIDIKTNHLAYTKNPQ